MNEQTNKKESIFKKPWMQSLSAIVIIFTLLIGFLFWQSKRNTVFIENSLIDAPVVNLASTTSGTLNAIYVKEGDAVKANTQVALVGSQIITAKEDGVVILAQEVLGGYIAPGQTVVSVVNNNKMKVVGSVEETKGLNKIAKGDYATFSVDAFPGKTFEGIVDEVGSVSNDAGVLFSISDKRPIKKFNVTVRFNTSDYPLLKSGMSAKITVHTK